MNRLSLFTGISLLCLSFFLEVGTLVTSIEYAIVHQNSVHGPATVDQFIGHIFAFLCLLGGAWSTAIAFPEAKSTPKTAVNGLGQQPNP